MTFKLVGLSPDKTEHYLVMIIIMGTLFIFLTVGMHRCDGLTQFPPHRATTATSGTT